MKIALRLRRRSIRLWIVSGVLLMVASVAAYFILSSTARADSAGDWMNGNINLSVDNERTSGTPTSWESQTYCEYRGVYIDDATTRQTPVYIKQKHFSLQGMALR